MIIKIKVMSTLSKKIKSLNEGENFIFTYNGKNYEFNCYSVSERFGNSYSVREANKILGGSMNVDKVTKQYITLYDYNLFLVRSTYKIPVNKIEII
jgi:hypothetical protein